MLNCKLCEESPAEVAFLPCGHLATCSDCAPAMKSCLICKVVVKATVKVFMPWETCDTVSFTSGPLIKYCVFSNYDNYEHI